MQAKSELNCSCYCYHFVSNCKTRAGVFEFKYGGIQNSNPVRVGMPMSRFKYGHNSAKKSCIGCTVRRIAATTETQIAGVMLLRPLYVVACLHCNYCGWKQSSGSCTVIGTFVDRHIKRCTCLLWWQNKNIASRSHMDTGQSFQLCLH
jgi:hypothetical protein